jgi:hypothetical protein
MKRTYCAHREPLASGFCPDCETHVGLDVLLRRESVRKRLPNVKPGWAWLRVAPGVVLWDPTRPANDNRFPWFLWAVYRRHDQKSKIL